MKKIFKWFGLALITTAIISFTADQQNPNAQKNQSKNQNKGNDQNPQKVNKGNNKQDNPGQGNNKNQGNDKGQGNDNNQGKKGQGNQGKDEVKDDKIKNENRPDKDENRGEGYSWNRENFKDRNKVRNQNKVTICHKFNRGDGEGVTISVSENALKAHMNHGDVTGSCPTINDRRYSDRYYREREDYYNYLQNGQEQVIYSRSILDYALMRLADSRLQLNQYETGNYPPAEIERKRLVVTELEQNVGLLETLLAVAAEVVVSKLMN